MRTLTFGTKLPNGATVVEYRNGIVLGRTDRTTTEWATWSIDLPYLDSTAGGHYFGDLSDAVADFENRSR